VGNNKWQNVHMAQHLWCIHCLIIVTVIPVIHEYFQCSYYFLSFLLCGDMFEMSAISVPYLS